MMTSIAKVGLVRRKECWVPTLRGWLLVGVAMMLAVILFVRNIHGYLAVNHPLQTEILVVEGWLPDYALEAAAAEFKRGGYRLLVTTGPALEVGNYLIHYKSFAELAKETLTKVGVPTEKIRPVSAPQARRNRTYQSALAVKRWLSEWEPEARGVTLVTCGAHTRRSWRIYRTVMAMDVGVICIPNQSYDAETWWRTSQGAKSVIEEIIAYTYACIQNR